MKSTVLKYGFISGGVLAMLTAVLVPLCMNGEGSEALGYTTMVLSFLAIFFGIRSYRQEVGGGAITFKRAFQVGILISLISCAVYVIGWEIAYWGFIPDFGERYSAKVLEKLQKSGADAARIAAEAKKLAEFQKMYKNPVYNVAITFMEVFPVGLVVTLISAGILRKKSTDGGTSSGMRAEPTAG